MRGLRTFRYVFLRGVMGMRQSPLVQTVAVLTMAVCILLLGAVSLILINTEGIVDGWGVDVPMTVYLNEEATDCLLYTSPSPRDKRQSRMPSSA